MIEIKDIKDLCFAKFAKRLQNAMRLPNDDGEVVDVLLGWIIEMPGVSGRKNQPITLGTTSVSYLMNRKENIHRSIKTAGGWPSTYTTAEKYFREAVMPLLNQIAVADMFEEMKRDINSDEKIAPSKAKELVALLDSGEEAKFLAHLFLYVLTRDNRDPAKAIKKPKKEKKKSSVSSQEVSQTVPLPILRPDTHYNIFAFRSSYSEGNPVSLSVNVNRLTQNDDQSVMDAFNLRTAEMIKQIRTLPCLFSDCGDFDDVGVPYFERDFVPCKDNVFAFGYIEDISFAKGKEDILVTVRPRIRQPIPQKELIDNQIHIYTKIGLRYPAPFYCEGLTIVEGNLIAGLRELGIEI